MKTTPNLNPCPFCGNTEPTIVSIGLLRFKMHKVTCATCEASSGWRRNPDEAVEGWNLRRTDIPKLGEILGNAELNRRLSRISRTDMSIWPDTHKETRSSQASANEQVWAVDTRINTMLPGLYSAWIPCDEQRRFFDAMKESFKVLNEGKGECVTPDEAEKEDLSPDGLHKFFLSTVSGNDEESEHIAMDNQMCKVLKSLGYEKAVEVFEQACKWYA